MHGAYRLPPEFKGHEKSEKWFLNELELGHTDAHRYLYSLYSDEKYPLCTDYDKAFFHASQVLVSGSGDVYNVIGHFSAEGKGTKRDLLEGGKWLYLHACQSSKSAVWEPVRAVFDQLSSSDQIKIKEACDQWIKDNIGLVKGFRYSSGLVDPITGTAMDMTAYLEYAEANQAKDDRITTKSIADTKKLNKEQLALVSKWHKHIADNTAVDTSELYALFFHCTPFTEDVINDLFQYYDCASQLKERFKSLCALMTDKLRLDVNLQDIERWARQDALHKFELCQPEDDLQEEWDGEFSHVNADFFKIVPARFVTDSSELSEIDKNNETMGLVYHELLFNDALDKLYNIKGIKGYYGLNQALYGMLNDYTLVAYFMSPFASLETDFEPYLNIRRSGARYILTAQELVLYYDPRRELVN